MKMVTETFQGPKDSYGSKIDCPVDQTDTDDERRGSDPKQFEESIIDNRKTCYAKMSKMTTDNRQTMLTEKLILQTSEPQQASTPQPPTAKKPLTKFQEIANGFDIIKNMSGLTKSRRIDSATQVFELLRAVSMLWIVYAHTATFKAEVFNKQKNQARFPEKEANDWIETFIMTGFFAVDFFLIMGGYVSILFVSKTFMELKDSKLWKLPALWVFMIFKRYFRVMPAYFFMMMFFKSITPYMLSSSYAVIDICHGDLIWQGLNLFSGASTHPDVMCMLQCWYLVIDFQMFLFVPGIVILHMINKRLAIGVTCSMIAASIAWGMYILYTNKSEFGGASWDVYYVDWRCRGCVYFLGCLMSQMSLKPVNILRKKRIASEENQGQDAPQVTQQTPDAKPESKPEAKGGMSQKAVMISVLIGLGSFVIIATHTYLLHFYFQHGRDQTKNNLWFSTIFISFGKFFFVGSVMIFLIMLCKNFKALPNFIANNSMIQFLGNLSFTYYLCHIVVIMTFGYNDQDVEYVDHWVLAGSAVGYIFYTTFLAVFVAMGIEYPLAVLWKVMVETPFLTNFKDKPKPRPEIALVGNSQKADDKLDV
jgi:peptidoglycan/LPS O-acetylase OafA/YrhL